MPIGAGDGQRADEGAERLNDRVIRPPQAHGERRRFAASQVSGEASAAWNHQRQGSWPVPIRQVAAADSGSVPAINSTWSHPPTSTGSATVGRTAP